MSHAPTSPGDAAPVRHTLYTPGYAMAKALYALLGVALLVLSLDKLGPLAKLAFTGGQVRAEAVRIIRTDAAGQETAYTADADVLSAVKAGEEARDRASVFWVEYRFAVDGKTVEARAPLGQHVKPLQPLRDADGLPSTSVVWYDRAKPTYIALPLEFGTWFLPGMLVLFGVLGTFMGLTLRRHATTPIEMPDLSHSHAEANSK